MTSFIYKYRWFIIFVCLTIGIITAILIPGTRIDPEIRNYVPSSMESRIETDKIEKEFGVQDIVVILFTDSCIIDSDNLKQIRNIDRAISKINGVSGRISPFTVRNIKSQEGMMLVEPLINKIPGNAQEIIALKKEILRNNFAGSVCFSSDLTTACITATINSSQTERSTLTKIDSILNSNPGKVKITKGGLPFIRQQIIYDVSKDAIYLIPASLIIMLIVFKINLGDWRSVIIPFSVVVLATSFSAALIPLFNWRVSIITLLLPVILIAVANNYGIYLVAGFQELNSAKPKSSKKELILKLLKSLNMPILFSGLTTIAGVLALITHSILPARQMGILAAAGVSLALIMSLLLIPALIFVIGTGQPSNYFVRTSTGIFNRSLNKLSYLIIRTPGKILLLSLVFIVILSAGTIFLKINTNQENYFSKNTSVRRASELINSKFGGSQTISVMITGDIKKPDIMKGIDTLTRQLEKQKGVGKIFSISQVVREMSKAIFISTESGYDKIPDSGDGIAQMFELYNMSGDQDDFKQLMNSENSRSQILVRLAEPENNVIKTVKASITELTKKLPAEVSIGGYAIIMDDFAGSIIKGQVSSLLFAVITVLILLTIIFRSLKGGLTGSIPLIASILVLFGFMGYTGIALDAATALLSSVMIGVGIDFTIQYIWCFNLQIRSGLSYPDAVFSAMKTIGRSIIINALSVMAGFSVLIFSGFSSIRFFGYLVIISIGSCLAGALILIPAFLMKFRPRFIGFEISNNRKKKNEKENDIIGFANAALAGGGATS